MPDTGKCQCAPPFNGNMCEFLISNRGAVGPSPSSDIFASSWVLPVIVLGSVIAAALIVLFVVFLHRRSVRLHKEGFVAGQKAALLNEDN